MDKKIIEGIWKAFQEVQEKKLSPAQKKHFDKDNDGDIDDADMALLNKKKKTDESSCGKMRKEEKVKCPKCDGKGCDHCDDTGYHMKEEAPDAPIKKADARKGDKSNAQPSELKTEEADWLENLAAQLEAMEIAEKKDAHTKGATEPEGIMDKESPKSKEFADAHKKSDKEMEDKEEKGHDDVSKAGRAVKSQSPARRGDNLKGGDNKPVK